MLTRNCEPGIEKTKYEPIELDDVDVESLLSSDDDDNRTHSSSKPNPPATSSTPAHNLSKSLLPSISSASLAIVLKLCILFAVDSFASGLVPMSLVTYYFTTKFSIPSSALGTLFFVTSIVAAMSNLVASSISKRIGLIKTMVFTHLPSAIFLALIPAPPQVFLAMTFLVLRSCLSSMDQAPRQAFLAAAILSNERTAVMGVVNITRTLAQSGGPVVTGWLAGDGKFWISFVVAGGLKAAYDLAMLKLFVGFKGRESEHLERES